MPTVNILQAGFALSRLVDAVERGVEREIIISRNGRPAAKLVPIVGPAAGPRLGVAKGRFEVSADIGSSNAEAARIFPRS
jgi:prevent-host-death family protein